MSTLRIGIYVDAVSVSQNGGFGLRYDALRQYACRKGDRIGRANVYTAVDHDRKLSDEAYAAKVKRFTDGLRDFQFKVLERPFSYSFNKENGARISSTTVDVEMAIDILEQSTHLDKIVLLTNNLAYAKLIQKVQDAGCRVELLMFDNVPSELRKEADVAISGFLIPGLLPVSPDNKWGEVGSRVRGICYDYNAGEGYGFMRFIKKVNEHMWIADSREIESPYQTVFAHISQFEKDFNVDFIPSRELIFEFTIGENDKGLIAEDIHLISAP